MQNVGVGEALDRQVLADRTRRQRPPEASLEHGIGGAAREEDGALGPAVVTSIGDLVAREAERADPRLTRSHAALVDRRALGSPAASDRRDSTDLEGDDAHRRIVAYRRANAFHAARRSAARRTGGEQRPSPQT